MTNLLNQIYYLWGGGLVCWVWGHNPTRWQPGLTSCARCRDLIFLGGSQEGLILKARIGYLVYSLAELVIYSQCQDFIKLNLAWHLYTFAEKITYS